jgi:hypothetical protein
MLPVEQGLREITGVCVLDNAAAITYQVFACDMPQFVAL